MVTVEAKHRRVSVSTILEYFHGQERSEMRGRFLEIIAVLLSCIFWASFAVAQGSREIVLSRPNVVITGNESNIFMNHPSDCTVAVNGNIYVIDMNNAEVLVFSESGAFLFRIGRRGQGPGEFLLPRSIASDHQHIFVSDSDMNRVTVFTLDGKYFDTISVRGQPNRIEVYEGSLFVATRSVHTILWEVQLSGKREPKAVLTYENELLEGIPVLDRLDYPELTIVGKSLVVGLRPISMLVVYSIVDERIERVFRIENELTAQYLRRLEQRSRQIPGYVRDIPRQFFGLTSVLDRWLLVQVQVSYDEGEPSTLVVVDFATGAETGVRLVAAGGTFGYPKSLRDGRFAWISLDEAAVYLYETAALVALLEGGIKTIRPLLSAAQGYGAPIVLETESVYVMHFAKSSGVWYWKDGEYHFATISD